MKRWLIGVAVVGVLMIGAIFAAVRSVFWFPAAVAPGPVACALDTPLLPRGTPIKVLVWNIQFSANRDQHFFYDGGEAVSVPSIQVERTVDGIAAFIKAQQPDIVVLQEVDRDSRRTGNLDQHAMLRERLGLACHTATPYHRSPYVPVPAHEPMGRVDMNLSVFSRYRIDSSTRHQLALLAESPLRRLFNLRRAAMDVSLPIEGGGALSVVNTHLSAFSRNDGTLERQVGQLAELADAASAAGRPWLLIGDLNALPPNDSPGRLEDGASFYGAVSGVQPLFDRFASPFPPHDEDSLRTYVPWGSTQPDRIIDYLFHDASTQVSELTVHRDAYPLSDHLPFTVTVVIE